MVKVSKQSLLITSLLNLASTTFSHSCMVRQINSIPLYLLYLCTLLLFWKSGASILYYHSSVILSFFKTVFKRKLAKQSTVLFYIHLHNSTGLSLFITSTFPFLSLITLTCCASLAAKSFCLANQQK